jgi:hypothetical protein
MLFLFVALQQVKGVGPLQAPHGFGMRQKGISPQRHSLIHCVMLHSAACNTVHACCTLGGWHRSFSFMVLLSRSR